MPAATTTDLRALRKQLGLTQAQLAAALGVSRWTIIEREAGRVPITRETELAMAHLALTQPHQTATPEPEHASDRP